MKVELERRVRQFAISVFLLFFFRILDTAEAFISRRLIALTRPFFGIAHHINNKARSHLAFVDNFKKHGNEVMYLSRQNKTLLQENIELRQRLADINKLELAKQIAIANRGYHYLNIKVLRYSFTNYGIATAIVIDESKPDIVIYPGSVVASNNHLVGKVIEVSSGNPSILKIQLASSASFAIPAKSADQKYYLLRGNPAKDGKMIIDNNQLLNNSITPGEALFIANVSGTHLPEIPIGIASASELGTGVVELFENLDNLEFLQIILPKNTISPR